MKKNLNSWQRLSAVLTITLFGLLLTSCSKDEIIPAQSPQTQSEQAETRVSYGFHWRCTCGLLNPGWRTTCPDPGCEKEYSNEYKYFSLSILEALTRIIAFNSGAGLTDATIDNRVELPNNLVLEYGPSAWYETPKALKFYNDLKGGLFNTDAPYLEGVDFGWYQTTHLLYPGNTNLTRVQQKHSMFLVNEGKTMRDRKGTGIKAGIKAAIDAFGAR